jgi:hypothetical protein
MVSALAPLLALMGTLATAYFGYLGTRQTAIQRAAEAQVAGNKR